MAGYNPNSYTTAPYYPTNMGGANFSPYSYQTAVPMAQPQAQNSSGNIMTIFIGSEEEANSYPVAAGTTVLLLCFQLKKFWLKSTSTSGVPEQLREFSFDEKTPAPVASSGVTRQEFDSLSKKIDKLINDLGGASNG